MRKLSKCFLILLFLWGLSARAQTFTANLTAADSGPCTTAAACLVVTLNLNQATSVVQLTGTFSATLQFEGTAQAGGTFVAINAVPVGGTTAVTSATSTGAWRIAVAGLAQIRVRCSTYVSGTVAVAITSSQGSSASSSAGGTSTPGYDTLVAGANTNTGTFSMTQPGSFLVAAANRPYIFSVTGGGSCNPNTAINPSGGTTINNDALVGCANIPSGSNVTNAFTDAVAGYVINNNSSQLGQFGKAEGVAVYGAATCTANNSKCEGGVFQAADQAGVTGAQLLGIEMDVGSNDTSATGYGFYTQYQGSAQPTGDNFPAVYIQSPAGAGTFTSGFQCASGATNSTLCLTLGQNATGNNQNSQSIKFNAHASGAGAAISATIGFNQDNLISLGVPGAAIISPTTTESYAISLTATAAVPVNTLMKIDTAHADAMVICTTGDTSCDGFVQATNNGTGLCTVGSTFCTIVTVPGSKVHGIIGTGTCAIGNFVIVDTTTNGDIQCTGSLPTISKIIGKALSACAATCAGTTIDVLTKFE